VPSEGFRAPRRPRDEYNFDPRPIKRPLDRLLEPVGPAAELTGLLEPCSEPIVIEQRALDAPDGSVYCP
jgi:hypothetical protein